MANGTDNSNVFFKGAVLAIAYAVRADGSMPSKEFLESLAKADRTKLRVNFEKLGNMGKITNRERFKHIEGKIFGFKAHQVRIGCFRDGMTWFLTHGFIKKEDDWRPQEVRLAETIRQEYLERKKHS